jgi:hypothetical protein
MLSYAVLLVGTAFTRRAVLIMPYDYRPSVTGQEMRLFIVFKQHLHYVLKVNRFIDFTGLHIGCVYFTLNFFNIYFIK